MATTVADAIKALADAVPKPTEVIEVYPKLTGSGVARLIATRFWMWLFRALVVWSFLATFFPALGVTYIMVLAGLWALAHVHTPKHRELLRVITGK